MPKALWLAFGMVLCGASSGFATTTLTLASTGPANLGGVYTSPYIATINDSSTGALNSAVICDDFSDDVYLGETWSVTATSLAALTVSTPVMYQGQIGNYITAAVLAEELIGLNSPTSTEAKALSYAIWSVFDPGSLNAITNAVYNTTTGETYAEAVQQMVSDAAGSGRSLASFTDVTIYTPLAMTNGQWSSNCSSCGRPQEFLTVSMAEPAAPVLLIVDLLAVFSLVWFVRRKQGRMSLR